MPRTYTRKTNRGQWSQETLTSAIQAIKKDHISIHSASRKYKIPRPTLQRHLKLDHILKKPLGRDTVLGKYEQDLETFLISMTQSGFNYTTSDLRRIAFEFAEENGIDHRFNRKTRTAGYDWLKSFMNRHPRLAIERAEAKSIQNSVDVRDDGSLHNLVQVILRENNLDKDESLKSTAEEDEICREHLDGEARGAKKL